MKVISISGGRSSAMMLYILKENGLLNDAVVCFANTGKESPETLEFIHECSLRWNIPVVWLEFTTAKPKFRVVDFHTASRKGEPFEQLLRGRGGYLPNPTQRFCTGDLKVKTIRRYIRSLNIKGHFDSYLGLRYDEPDRVSKKKAQNASGKEPEVCFMPLYDLRITINERDVFWRQQPFDLKISSISDNCDLCFMKGKNNLVWAIRAQPESVEWWIKQEEQARKTAKKKRHGQFRNNYSYQELKELAMNQTFLPLADPITQSITCNCTD